MLDSNEACGGTGYIECQCGGGKCTCDCGNTHDCDMCGGSGKQVCVTCTGRGEIYGDGGELKYVKCHYCENEAVALDVLDYLTFPVCSRHKAVFNGELEVEE